MPQITMYPPKNGSPQTTTTAILSEGGTTVSVQELACFPEVGPEGGNLITFWNDVAFETCEYTSKSSASGTGTLTIVRSGARHASTSGGGIEWPVGTKCARTGTGYDFTAFKNNIQDLNSRTVSLETNVSSLNNDVTSLDTRLDTAEAEIDALQASNAEQMIVTLIFG